MHGLTELFPAAAGRSFDIVLWNGKTIDPLPSSKASRIIFKDKHTFKKLFFSGDLLTAGDGYVEGRIDLDGDIAAIIREMLVHSRRLPLSLTQKIRFALSLLFI